MSGTSFRMLISIGAFAAIFFAAQHVEKLEGERVAAAQREFEGPLASEIQRVSSTVLHGEELLVLKATLSTTKNVNDIQVRWLLPSNVSLVSGSKETKIVNLKPAQPFQTQITLRQKGLSNTQIHFIASGEEPGLRFSSVSLYNTIDEEFLQHRKEIALKSLSKKSKQRSPARLLH